MMYSAHIQNVPTFNIPATACPRRGTSCVTDLPVLYTLKNQSLEIYETLEQSPPPPTKRPFIKKPQDIKTPHHIAACYEMY
jgi:hypothetical protein